MPRSRSVKWFVNENSRFFVIWWLEYFGLRCTIQLCVNTLLQLQFVLMRHRLTFYSSPQENTDASWVNDNLCSWTSLWFTGTVTLLIVTSIKKTPSSRFDLCAALRWTSLLFFGVLTLCFASGVSPCSFFWKKNVLYLNVLLKEAAATCEAGKCV